jgi:uncharacterized protein YjhX (UPF0386 family)
MNNSQLQQEPRIIATMVSGVRDDAWHWRDSDVSQFSSEKLSNILRLAESARCEEDRLALKKVREELENRAKQLARK